jgi:nitrogen fixation protein FixH
MSTLSGKSTWRLFPLALLAALAVVAAVNATLVTLALHSHPGAAGEDGFDISNHYDIVLQDAKRQAALGWRITITQDGAHHISLTATDRTGAALPNVAVTLKAERPVGPARTTPMTLHESADGNLVTAEALPPGQWMLQLGIESAGQALHATKRLIVK